MKYFKLNESTKEAVTGKSYPQANGVYSISVDDKSWIHKEYKHFQKIEKDVRIPKAILAKKSTKLTDLLSGSGYGFSFRLLVSNKLKEILERQKQLGIQFLQTGVFDAKGEKEYNYWLVNCFIFFPEYVDFNKSELYVEEKGLSRGDRVYCDSIEDFEYKSKLYAPRRIRIGKYSLNESLVEYDFFVVNHVHGVIDWIVSEKLKNEIEAAGCTGIDFEEIN